jgi:hypothetical protein
MKPTLKTYVCRTIGAVAVLAAGFPLALAGDVMPVAQQNALVLKYCAVCHTDASMNGGLSLEHFDAAHADPGEAAMLASKLKAKALGASGQPLPDRATQDALQSALSAEAVGAGRWIVNRTQDPATKAPILTASVVQEVPPANGGADPDLYRLKLTCRVDTHEADMQLAWSPGVPERGRAMSVVVDGNAPLTYKVEGSEKMGNGGDVISGPGAVSLYSTTGTSAVPKLMPLPVKTLTVSNLFGDETVVFPFGGMTETARQALSTCLTGAKTGSSR